MNINHLLYRAVIIPVILRVVNIGIGFQDQLGCLLHGSLSVIVSLLVWLVVGL